MRKETFDCIIEAAEDCGVELDQYEDYSGRGMFGSKTFGVVGKFRSLIAAVAVAARNLEDSAHEEFVEDLQNLRFDNLGRDFIFY